MARALLRRPELVIFDEATSHLDTVTEHAIQRSLKLALVGKTVVLVAHRLSTVKHADLIYVLHRGRIVQAGTHTRLLEQEGMYRTLWQAQTHEEDGIQRPYETVVTLNGSSHYGAAIGQGSSYAS